MDKSTITKKKRIAIIGAGLMGMCSIVALKEEGLIPVCFELSDRHGGLWNYRETPIEGFGSIMPNTTLNQSKEMGAFSNFPPKKEYSNFMRHTEVFEYLTEYYKYHDCERYIHFNTEVINVKKAEDYEETGHLSVTVKDNISGTVSTDIFDGMMVATGHINYPKHVDFPGLKKFKGEVMHTHGVKRLEKFTDKNVLIIGTGCSGLDTAEYISTVTKQVYLSSRTGVFAISKLGPGGYPIDYVLLRRYLTFLLDYLPLNFCSWYLETFYLDTQFDHTLYYMKPKYHVLSKEPSVNGAIYHKLLSGTVVMKPAVKHFTENGVVFDKEETVTKIDVVVMATGYTYKFPFLEDGLLQINDGQIDLYKCIFPAHLPHSSLTIVGFGNPFGPGFPAGEIQTRWVARVLAGKEKLPTNEIMHEEALRRHQENERRFAPSEFTSIRGDFVSYQDDLALLIGCKPNLLKYLFTDLPLFMKLLFGPSLPYQYRLEGPHKWEGAREAIMTCEERMRWPLSREKRRQIGILQQMLEYIINLIPRNVLIK